MTFLRKRTACAVIISIALFCLTGCQTRQITISTISVTEPTSGRTVLPAGNTVVTTLPSTQDVTKTTKTTKATKATKIAKAITTPTTVIQSQKIDPATVPTAAPVTAPTTAPRLTIDFTPLSATAYYGRSQLAKAANGAALVKAYDRIAAGVEALQATISLNDTAAPINTTEFVDVYTCYRNDHPQHFWLGNSLSYAYSDQGMVLELQPTYNMTASEAHTAAVAVQNITKTILQKAAAGADAFEQEKILHDHLLQTITYNTDTPHSYDLYGALCEGKACCDGYTEAMQYLLYQIGIPCLRVKGESTIPHSAGQSTGHAWNILRIDNAWYHLDVTWDDQDTPAYVYFNVTDEVLSRDHVFGNQGSYVLPSCTATAANYHVRNGSALSAYTVDKILSLLKAGNGTAQFSITGDGQDFPAWLSANHRALAQGLSLADRSYTYTYSILSNEILLTISNS